MLSIFTILLESVFILFLFLLLRKERKKTARALAQVHAALEEESALRHNIKRKLYASEARFQRLFDNLPYMLLECSSDGKIIAANIQATRGLGSGEKMSDSQESELVDQQSVQHKILCQAMEMAKMGEGNAGVEQTFSMEDNGEGYISWKSFVLLEREENSVGYMLVGEDITRQKHLARDLAESERRFQTLFEETGDAFVIHNLQGEVITVNRMTCALLGYRKKELIGANIADMDRNFDRKQAEEIWPQVLSGSTFLFFGKSNRKDGTFFDSEVRLVSIPMDGKDVILAMVRDMSELTESEDNPERM